MIRCLSVLLLLFLGGCGPSHFSARQAGGLRLYLDLPEASEVLFVSSADSFQPHPTTKTGDGLWVTRLLADQEFHYFYRVDGRLYVPDCRYSDNDDFGTRNCIYQP